MNPRSVVVVGASRRTGEDAFNILENLLNYGYTGRVYAVNPRAMEICGRPSFPTALDLPEVPDLAIITVPREIMPEVIRACCARGIRTFILVTQGLAEADERGAAMQAEFMAELRRHGARALGPNTLGTVNSLDGFSSSFMPVARREPIPSGVICQTGLFLGTNLGPTTGIGKGIDVGNQADLGVPDALRHLGEDPRVEVVAIHLEGLRPGEGRLFVETAREVTAKKPVLIYKTARSAVGSAAAGSHSGSLAGSDRVYEAAFEEAGVIRLEDVDDMDDSVKAFVHLPPIRGRRVAVVSASGGGGIMAADACEDYGLELAAFSPETMNGLRELYPEWMEPGNPLDVWPASIGKAYPAVFQACFELVVNDPGVDGIVCIGGAFSVGGFDVGEFVAASAELRRDKPVVWWLQGREAAPMATRIEASRRVAVYPSPERAVRALARLAAYHVDIRARRPDRPRRPAGCPKAGSDATRGPVAAGSGPTGSFAAGLVAGAGSPAPLPAQAAVLPPAETFALLETYGLPVARWAVAAGPEEAVRAAERVGLPVALKAVGPGIVHKSELGLVRLSLGSTADVAEAARDLLRKATGAATGGGTPGRPGPSGPEPPGVPALAGLLVQEFLPGGHEVIVGAKQDPHFGPTVVFGLGGIYAEVLADVAAGLAPLSPAGARRLLERTRAYPILRGARGQEAADLDALVEAVVRLSWLAAEHPELSEIDLNPVKVFGGKLGGKVSGTGKGCRVVDARFVRA